MYGPFTFALLKRVKYVAKISSFLQILQTKVPLYKIIIHIFYLPKGRYILWQETVLQMYNNLQKLRNIKLKPLHPELLENN